MNVTAIPWKIVTKRFHIVHKAESARWPSCQIDLPQLDAPSSTNLFSLALRVVYTRDSLTEYDKTRRTVSRSLLDQTRAVFPPRFWDTPRDHGASSSTLFFSTTVRRPAYLGVPSSTKNHHLRKFTRYAHTCTSHASWFVKPDTCETFSPATSHPNERLRC